jgi:inositol-1,3,4-trisphosphate 5/6-kinase/inositol-tetrakisphosphate 1-kinase
VCNSPSLPPEQQLLLFDSLASLPTQLPPHMVQQQASSDSSNTQGNAHQVQQQQQQQEVQQPNMQAVEAVAAYLRSQLGLTLFGFDVVVASSNQPSITEGASSEPAAPAQQQQQQELVVIDVNYFPNYRGGSNTPALFRQALLQRWQQHAAGQL